MVLEVRHAARRRLRRARPRSDARRAVLAGARRRALGPRRARTPRRPRRAEDVGLLGLHVYIPLPEGTSYEAGRLLCEILATIVAHKHRKEATVERTVGKRGRTVYVDYLQNILGKTLATAYSPRASEFGGVSTPLTWDEVDEGVSPGDFTIKTAPARFAAMPDLWRPVIAGPPVDLHGVLERMARDPNRSSVGAVPSTCLRRTPRPRGSPPGGCDRQ